METSKQKNKSKKGKISKPYQNKGWLERRYIEERLSLSQIARLVGRTPFTILYWINRHELDKRDRIEGIRNFHKQNQIKKLELYKDANWLREMYVEKRLSTCVIARMAGVNQGVVSRYLKEQGIEARTKSEGMKNFFEANPGAYSGENSHLWVDGTTTTWNGYICVWQPENESSTMRGYVRRSRLVCAKGLGRPLKPGETPHHVGGDKTRDEWEYLWVFQSLGEHIKYEAFLRRDYDRNGNRKLETEAGMEARR